MKTLWRIIWRWGVCGDVENLNYEPEVKIVLKLKVN
jgi:hypothetical protein